MSTAPDIIAALRKKARRQKILIAASALLLTLPLLLIANGFGLLSWWIEWPVKFVIYGIAGAIWAFSAQAIDARVERETQAALDAAEAE